MEIKSKKEGKLLERTEILAEMEANIPPSRESAKQAVASSLKADQNLVVIKKITPVFGQRRVTILAHIYKTEAKLKEVECKSILNKGKKKSIDKPAEE